MQTSPRDFLQRNFLLPSLSVLQPCGRVQVSDQMCLVEPDTGFGTEHLDGAHMPLKQAETVVPK